MTEPEDREERQFNDTLKRMLKTPPNPKLTPIKPKGEPKSKIDPPKD